MKKELKIELDDELYQRLLNQCGGDEEVVIRFIIEVLSKTVETDPIPSAPSNLDASGLQDYLHSSQPGSRRQGYGAKGQGW